MTQGERINWACEVLNHQRHGGFRGWHARVFGGSLVSVVAGSDGQEPNPCFDRELTAPEAVAIALALDEQTRRKLPEKEQADWAVKVLRRRRHEDTDGWFVVGGPYPIGCHKGGLRFQEAIALAESYVRREMLGEAEEAT